MKNKVDGRMGQVLVKVFGFSDVERHALNTVFRLSQDGLVSYGLWTEEAPRAAGILLVDGENWEARVEMARPSFEATPLIWVGGYPPPQAWKAFSRPVRWDAVVDAMDQLFTGGQPQPVQPAESAGPFELDLDISRPPVLSAATLSAVPAALSSTAPLQAQEFSFDLDLDLPAAAVETRSPPVSRAGDDMVTEPSSLADAPAWHSATRVLLADPDRDTRLYLMAKLAAVRLFGIDEAVDGAGALALAGNQRYLIVILDLGIQGDAGKGWSLLRRMRELQKSGQIKTIILTSARATPLMGLKAWLAGAGPVMLKPFHPARLMRRVEAARR